MKLRGRLYPASSKRPVIKAIHTLCNAGGRTPRLDILLSQHQLQPHIHDKVVTVVRRGVRSRFHIFFKNHRHLLFNETLRRKIHPEIRWRGDIVVMRKGMREEVVNFRSGDIPLADFAVKK